MVDLTLYQLSASTNSMKARIALNFKGLPFTAVEIDPADRSGVLEVSGQPLTPVLVHGDTVICDSAAIMRYLDCNFRDTPKLMFEDVPLAREADGLEKWVKGPLTEPVGMVFTELFSESPDLGNCERASTLLNERAAELERRLSESDWLLGGRMSFVDATAAPVVMSGMVPEELASTHPMMKFFHDNMHLGEGRDRVRAWAQRVMAYNQGG